MVFLFGLYAVINQFKGTSGIDVLHNVEMFIPVAALFTLFSWFFLTPKKFEINDDGFEIESRSGEKYKYRWDQLEAYLMLSYRSVFMIQFEDERAHQIFYGSFPKDQWGKVTNFFEKAFPDRKADYFIGTRLYIRD